MYYDDNTIIFAEGEFTKAKDARTGLYGQSLHYGYAVFEGIRSYRTANGETRIFKAVEHFERLKNSALAVGIPFPWSVTELIANTYELLRQNNQQNAYVRPLVYCPPNMSLVKAKFSHVTLQSWEWGAYLGNNLLRICLSSFQRPNPKAFKVEAKVSGHYVNSIMACQEAKDRGFDEALLLDSNDHVAEGPGANVFYEKDGKIYTPALGHILPGITRATVLELCNKLNIPVLEKKITVDELHQADSVFYCGTAAEIIGWKSFEETVYAKPWEETLGALLHKHYRNLVTENVHHHQNALVS